MFSDLQKSLVTNPIEQKTDSANSVVSDISTDQTGGDIVKSTGSGQSASDQSVPDTTEDMETETSSICIEEKPKDVNFKSLTLIDGKIIVLSVPIRSSLISALCAGAIM